MKKVLSVLVLFMAVLVVSAQTNTTTTVDKTTRVSVKVADLQQAIKDNVALDFPDYTIKEAFLVTTEKVVTYEVVIVKETATETLVYDKEGLFIKKLPPVVVPVKKM